MCDRMALSLDHSDYISNDRLALAAKIVIDAPIPVVMVPLNVTHSAIVNRGIDLRIRGYALTTAIDAVGSAEGSSPLRRIISTTLDFL